MALPALLGNYVDYGNGSSTGYYAVTAWATGAAKTVGNLVRQSAAPSVGNERVFVCVVAGTTHATTEPTWTVTRGAQTTDNTVTWQECTGQPATNGDMTNTIRWSVVKNTAVSLGVIIKDSGTNLFICTTAGTAGNGAEPTWNTTVGTTTADNTATWTCIKNAGYSNWSAPHARLVNAFATNWGAAGDDFWIGDDHAETQSGTLSMTCPGTVASPCRVLCVNHSGSVPPVSADLRTTATITTTSSASITIIGTLLSNGVSYTNGTSGGGTMQLVQGPSGIPNYQRYENCTFSMPNSGATQLIIGNNGLAREVLLEWENVKVSFAAVGSSIQALQGTFRWRNSSSALQGTVPTVLFVGATNLGASIYLRGVDLSAAGSGKSLINNTIQNCSSHYLENCKLGSSVSITSGSMDSQGSGPILAINCDSANTNYRYFKQTYQGTITHETTIVRSGGASDGTTAISRKMVSTANSKFYSPLESDLIRFWNESTSAVTVIVPVITDNVTLKNNDAWIEVEYPGNASFPISTFNLSNRAADVLNAGSNQATDGTSSWTTTGLSTPVKQTLTATFTPAAKGIIRVKVCLAKASTTMYFDPTVGISSASQYMLDGGMINDPDDPAQSAVTSGTKYNRNRSTGTAVAGILEPASLNGGLI